MLPARDKYLADYARWLDAKLAGVEDPEQRRLIELRPVASAAPPPARGRKGKVARTSFLRAKQSTTMGIDFLGWLARRGTSIGECTQHDVDAYFGAGPSTRLHARSFLYWARNTRKVRALEIPSGTTQSLMRRSATTSACKP